MGDVPVRRRQVQGREVAPSLDPLRGERCFDPRPRGPQLGHQQRRRRPAPSRHALQSHIAAFTKARAVERGQFRPPSDALLERLDRAGPERGVQLGDLPVEPSCGARSVAVEAVVAQPPQARGQAVVLDDRERPSAAVATFVPLKLIALASP